MRKNNMMRLASALLVLVLLTTCGVSGTFAKYITDNEASDTARVAKFGIVIQAGGALYADRYNGNSYLQFRPNLPSTSDNMAALSVLSQDSDKVVAPGTKNDDGLFFSLNGQPEVRTKLEVSITSENIYLKAGQYGVMVEAPNVTENSYYNNEYYTLQGSKFGRLSTGYDPNETYYTLENYVDVPEDYYPVVYKSTDKTDGNTKADSLNLIAADYAKKMNNNTEVSSTTAGDKTTYSFEAEYAPNFDYATLGAAGEQLTWEWAYEQKDGSGNLIDWTDKADTILGDLIAADRGELPANATVVWFVNDMYQEPTDGYEYNLNSSFDISISVTQMD